MPESAFTKKYRPKKLTDVVGQEVAVRTIANSFKMNRLHHAYLLVGKYGTGKTSLGRIISAHAHQGVNPDQDLDFNSKEVRDIFAGNSLDVIEMDAASNRKIEDVRHLKDDSRFAPVSGKKKIFLIDEAHSFTREAFNALLKVIEEPPPQLMFILCTTDAEKIPSTIASRCVRLDFLPLDWHEIYKQLQDIAKEEFDSFDEEALKIIAKPENSFK